MIQVAEALGSEDLFSFSHRSNYRYKFIECSALFYGLQSVAVMLCHLNNGHVCSVKAEHPHVELTVSVSCNVNKADNESGIIYLKNIDYDIHIK